MKFKTLLMICIFLASELSAQEIFYQDIYHGGVTGDGIGTYVSEVSRDFNVNIPLNSIIKKAFLFMTTIKVQSSNLDNAFHNRNFTFNNNNILLNNADTVTSFRSYGHPNPYLINIGLFAIEVTNIVSATQNTYTLTPPINQSSSAENGVFSDFYLFIAYENPGMDKINTAIILNQQDAAQTLSYHIDSLNAIDLANDVGFSFHSTWFCDTIKDGSYVSVNNNLLGLTGGDESPQHPNCLGVWGSFYYQNSTLFGLGNDTPDNSMNGVDALANIQPYITDPNEFDIAFEYQTPTYGNRSNPVLQLFFAYTTPCDTFSVSVTPDTTICYGEQVQLQATGGVSTGSNSGYEWSASTASQDTMNSSGVYGLSCSDCPNPIFTGEHSMSYSVRIWNNDSCSVVRPVRINVSRPQKVSCYTGETKCGASTGYIKANALPEDLDAWYVVTPNNDTLDQPIGNTFPNLGAGDYSVYYIDSLGCKSEDTIVTIEAYNNTVADFSVNPTTGSVPLEVEINNQSQNATDFEWLINGVSSGTSPTTFFDTSGVYEIGLVAWEIDASCADTTWKTVLVFDSLMAQLPNVFTPTTME